MWAKRSGFVLGLVMVGALLAGCGGNSGGSTSDSGRSTADRASIDLVASESLCIATGIDDLYTGDGHVEFFLTFKNSGSADGSITVIPVRHYDDGSSNSSGMDMVTFEVSAGSVQKFHTDKLKYKAHEHEITECGVEIGGSEVPIALVK